MGSLQIGISCKSAARAAEEARERFSGLVKSGKRLPGAFQEKATEAKLGILGGAKVSEGSCLNPLQSNPPI